MTSTSDLGVLAQLAYQAGITPLDFAEEQIALLVGVHAAIAMAGGASPEAFPDLPTGPQDFARRILGALLDAGWEPPVWPSPDPGGCT
jgi:hypothetical protein